MGKFEETIGVGKMVCWITKAYQYYVSETRKDRGQVTIIIFSGTGKAMNFKFCTHIHRIDRNNK